MLSAKAETTRSSIRLALDDEISSRPAAAAGPSDGRLVVNTLIQSHPDPEFAAFERRYQALPPFTEATEEVPAPYIALASRPVVDGFKATAAAVVPFVSNIRTQVRTDDVREKSELDRNGERRLRNYTTTLATVAPSFEYQQENTGRKLLLILKDHGGI